MEKVKNVINWIFSVVCLFCLPVYGLTAGSILLFLIGIISLPVSYIKELRSRLPMNRFVTVGILGVLFIVGVMILPTQEQSEDSSRDITSTEMSENTLTSKTNEEETDSNQTDSTEKTTTAEEKTTTEATTTEEKTTTEATTEEKTTAGATTMEEMAVDEPVESQETYVLNTNTLKFHHPWCSSVKKIKDGNRSDYTGSRDEVIGWGYSPCGNCNP